MSLTNYSEIQTLQNAIEQYGIGFKLFPNEYFAGLDYYKSVEVTIRNKKFDLFIFDEFNDLDLSNLPLCWCLVLNELEEYNDAPDYLVWCTGLGLPAENEQVRDYHMRLRVIYPKIEKLIGPIENPISGFDFQLNAGAAQALRNL